LLAVNLSPRKWEEIKYQEHIVKVLTNSLDQNKQPNNITLVGASGSGKTSIAKVYAASILCQFKVGGEPCGTCVDCLDIYEGNYSRTVRYVNGVTDNGIAYYRNVIDELYNHGSLFGDKKVLIIDEVHGLSEESLQAFLLPLEKQETNVYLIFATTESSKVKHTLVDRCLEFSLRIPNELDIAKYLLYIISEKLKLRASQEFLTDGVFEIACDSHGSLRKALHTLEKIILSKDLTLEGARAQLDVEVETQYIKILTNLLQGKYVIAYYDLDLLFSSMEPQRVFFKLTSFLIDAYRILVLKQELRKPVYSKMLVSAFKGIDTGLLTLLLDKLVEVNKQMINGYDKNIFLYELMRRMK
jgi:DNA polymerase III subunit gamma/tau